MEKLRPWCGQLSNGRCLKNRTNSLCLHHISAHVLAEIFVRFTTKTVIQMSNEIINQEKRRKRILVQRVTTCAESKQYLATLIIQFH